MPAFWHLALFGFGLLISLVATGHAVLHTRDSRAAAAWVGLIWFVPLVGSVLYFIFGVNRIRHQAAHLRRNLERHRAQAPQVECPPDRLQQLLPEGCGHLHQLARVVGGVVARPLLSGNRVEPLVNGDEAFPVMLKVIQQARHSIALVTFIFDRDEIGCEFARALGDAVRRGVAVRVLVDNTGIRFSLPTILRTLRREGVPYACFLPSFALWNIMSLNMCTHRKILVVDGRDGFTGGLNIRLGQCLLRNPSRPLQDLHFHVRGPVVSQFQEVFTDDWLFTTGEALRGEAWFPACEVAGPVLARGVVDGPDEHFEKFLWTILGALSIARHSIQIMTPYFIPNATVIAALCLAAMRGVRVDIILPEKINYPVVQCASRATWPEVLAHGCRIWLTPPPFDHTKLMVVDGCWVLLGSANWDARSMRLNFEFNVECYDVTLAQHIGGVIEKKRNASHPVTLADVNARKLPARLRDGLARLLTPYL